MERRALTFSQTAPVVISFDQASEAKISRSIESRSVNETRHRYRDSLRGSTDVSRIVYPMDGESISWWRFDRLGDSGFLPPSTVESRRVKWKQPLERPALSRLPICAEKFSA